MRRVLFSQSLHRCEEAPKRAAEMRKFKKKRNTSEFTPIALILATILGAGALYCAEIVYGTITDSSGSEIRHLPVWRAHMGSAWVGMVAFTICLFLLESLGRGSRRIAFRSVIPWAPLVALTGAATMFHIPSYVVVLIALAYSPWACFRTCAVR
jgi:hypothetical protein